MSKIEIFFLKQKIIEKTITKHILSFPLCVLGWRGGKVLAEMIILDELPFRFVENQ